MTERPEEFSRKWTRSGVTVADTISMVLPMADSGNKAHGNKSDVILWGLPRQGTSAKRSRGYDNIDRAKVDVIESIDR
jgi:hypothetical protein